MFENVFKKDSANHARVNPPTHTHCQTFMHKGSNTRRMQPEQYEIVDADY